MKIPIPTIASFLQTSRNKWFRVVVVIATFVAIMHVAKFVPWPWYVAINETNSLPYKVFIVVRNQHPKAGDYVDFWPPENEFYSGISFIKQVAAEPNEYVECIDRMRLIGNEVVAIAKENSSDGRYLHLGPCGWVPQEHLYVLAPHRDSFDSRYREIGYVPFASVRGVAYPLF